MAEQTEKKYEISTQPVADMSPEEIVAEYKFLRDRIAEDRWNLNYLGRMEDRKLQLQICLSDLFVEQFTKENENGRN